MHSTATNQSITTIRLDNKAFSPKQPYGNPYSTPFNGTVEAAWKSGMMSGVQQNTQVPLSVEQAIQLVKKRRTLRGIIKMDSLVVNGLDRSWDRASVEQELRSIFKESEGVKDIKIITNNVSQELLGHAYINYSSQEAARKALARHKYSAKVRGRQLKMMYSVRPNDLIHEDEVKMHFSVCVKNLDPAIDLKNLDIKFSNYGDILRSHVDDDTHGRDRFALIQFMDMSSAEEAVRMNQKAKFGNTIITVEPYRPKAYMDSAFSETLEQPRTPPLPRAKSLLKHMCDATIPANSNSIEERESGSTSEGRCSPSFDKEVSAAPDVVPINRWVNARQQLHQQQYSDVILADRKLVDSPHIYENVNNSMILPDVQSPVLQLEHEINGCVDSEFSQCNQQNKSIFFLDGSQQSRNSSNSPTAVSPPPPPPPLPPQQPSPCEEAGFNQYKLFEGNQIFNGQSIFGTSCYNSTNASTEQVELTPFLPQSLNQDLELQLNFKCPLSRQMYRDPVLASDGVIYERCQIEEWMANSQISPCTQQNFESMKLVSIGPLRDALQYIRQQSTMIQQQQLLITDLRKRMDQIKGLCSMSQF